MMATQRRPTMKDVAIAAGVSFKTVSRVVNGEPGVSAELADRVHAAIIELGYQRDDGAQALRRRGLSSSTIGVVHADIANPFFTAVHDALERVASEAGSLLLTGTAAGDVERQDSLVRAFAGRRVDGLVVVPVADDPASYPALTREIERGIPVVFIDRELDVPGDAVLSDHRGGAREATAHLLARGHRHIAFMSDDPTLFSAAERRIGFTDTMAAAEAEARIITGIMSPAEAERAVLELSRLDGPPMPTALFTAQNYITFGAVKALHARGLQHSVALVGFDDVPMADVIEPGLTVIAQHAEELGRRAGELLFGRLRGESTEPVREIVPVTLIERGSGEIPGPAALSFRGA